jgi:hypothetical protein
MSRAYVQAIETTLFDAVSMGTDLASDSEPVVNSQHARATFNFSIQGNWSAGTTPIGVLKLQCSIDNTNWDDVPGTEIIVGGSSGVAFWNLSYQAYKWVRLTYTRTSGSATFTALYNAMAYNV